jgi:UDP-N-acetylglucosamine 2-epimerase (non-hydrolysing)
MFKENIGRIIEMKPVMVVTGTRPEIIKMAPVIRALNQAAIPYLHVHCGQHYDYNMAQQFIENLELPTPNYTLKINAKSPGAQTARILLQMDQLIKKPAHQLCWWKATQTQCSQPQ